jgi:DNA polymerase-3 subunit delta'
LRSGRPPSAWLITGAPGVGKATLAYRIARYLLAYGATDAGPEDLSVPADHPAARQVAAQAHPGLLVLKRAVNPKTGKLMTETSVDVVRQLAGFFGLTSGAGGWRVAIVDTADDMNPNAANALLKALEEPPTRSMLMLLSTVPGKLLPTIRSRCQRLDLRPLGEDMLATELAEHLPKMSERDRSALAKLSLGSLGLALALSGEGTLALAREAQRVVDEAATANVPALLALADRVGRASDRLPTFGGFLIDALERRVIAKAQAQGASGLRRWLEAWEQVRANFDRAIALNLEPRQTIVSSTRAIHNAARNPG